MRKLEDFMNWLTDMDWGWWPVVFLRPPKDRDIDNVVLLKMTAWFGTIIAVITLLIDFRRTHTLTAMDNAGRVLFCWFAFFLLYKFTFAIFWNRRVKRSSEYDRRA